MCRTTRVLALILLLMLPTLQAYGAKFSETHDLDNTSVTFQADYDSEWDWNTKHDIAFLIAINSIQPNFKSMTIQHGYGAWLYQVGDNAWLGTAASTPSGFNDMVWTSQGTRTITFAFDPDTFKTKAERGRAYNAYVYVKFSIEIARSDGTTKSYTFVTGPTDMAVSLKTFSQQSSAFLETPPLTLLIPAILLFFLIVYFGVIRKKAQPKATS